MKWDYWISKYIQNYCLVRGLTKESIATYHITLLKIQEYMQIKKELIEPKDIKISDVFDYLEYLKVEKGNGQATLSKNAGILKNFLKGLVAMGYMDFNKNPMRDFRKLKAAPSRMRDIISRKEAKRILLSIDEDTVLGIRDRAIIILLYSTGIRASELCSLKEKDVDLISYSIKVFGKGQHERIVPLNEETVRYLKKYRKVRGEISNKSAFFKTRLGTSITRKGVFDRIKKYVRVAGIRKIISPHNLRHSFATELINNNVNLVTVQKILGHRCIASTIRYLRVTINDLREAIKRHPVSEFNDILNRNIPDVRLPYQLSRSGFT